jgi:hypothetical protein
MNAGTTKPPLRLPPFPKSYGARWLWVQAALRRLASAAGISLHIDGAESATVGSDGSMQFKVGAGGGGGSGTHPFKVSFVSSDTFHVEAGTIEGQTITAQNISVGSTRPVAILAYPQYTLSIYNSEYVWAAAVKTGASAPVLTSSTSILSDVSTGITSAGTQARAVIAYIDTGDVISQITTGNIVGTFADNGALTGTMAGSYNKNA